MSRGALIGLVVVLLVASGVNTYCINAYGRDTELVPMTAWQMFSGRPKRVTRHFVFEVVAHPGGAPQRIPGTEMFAADAEIADVLAVRILTGVWKSCSYGCPDYRLKNFRWCRKDPVRPWRIPADMADVWLRAATARLELESPPDSISMFLVEYTVDEDFHRNLESDTWTRIFTWRPSTGDYVVEDDGPEDDDP